MVHHKSISKLGKISATAGNQKIKRPPEILLLHMPSNLNNVFLKNPLLQMSTHLKGQSGIEAMSVSIIAIKYKARNA